jgi:hypothetical protein
MHSWQQGRARKRVTAFCSNIVVTIDVPGKYFIEIARSLTSRTIAGPLTLIQGNRALTRGIYICAAILIVRVNATILSAEESRITIDDDRAEAHAPSRAH